jgi:hypothetical protein
VPDEITTAIATTLATKGAEALVTGGSAALAALIRLVRRRFGVGGDTAALQRAQQHPEDPGRRHALAEALAAAMADDPDFARRLLAAWHDTTAELSAEHHGVTNHFSGHAAKVLQARDINGNVTF